MIAWERPVLLVFALLAARRHAPAGPYLFSLGVLSLTVAWLTPRLFEPAYGPWMRLAKVLAAVNTYLITAMIFYLVMTPYALVLRLLGKDLLDEKPGTGDSYWKPRGEASDPERQF